MVTLTPTGGGHPQPFESIIMGNKTLGQEVVVTLTLQLNTLEEGVHGGEVCFI